MLAGFCCVKASFPERAHSGIMCTSHEVNQNQFMNPVCAGVGRLQVGVKRVQLPYKKPLERPYFTASLVSENGAFLQQWQRSQNR